MKNILYITIMSFAVLHAADSGSRASSSDEAPVVSEAQVQEAIVNLDDSEGSVREGARALLLEVLGKEMAASVEGSFESKDDEAKDTEKIGFLETKPCHKAVWDVYTSEGNSPALRGFIAWAILQYKMGNILAWDASDDYSFSWFAGRDGELYEASRGIQQILYEAALDKDPFALQVATEGYLFGQYRLEHDQERGESLLVLARGLRCEWVTQLEERYEKRQDEAKARNSAHREFLLAQGVELVC